VAIRFVKPETVTLTLPDGTRLIVKKELNTGEQRAAFNRLYTQGADGKLRVDPMATGLNLVLAYLLDWTVADEDGPVAIRGLAGDELAAILNRLEPASFTEIKEAIEQHEIAVALERTEKKTTTPIESASDPISFSVS
jgi:hypothetical protein